MAQRVATALFLSILITSAVGGESRAQIYCYTDSSGVTHFTNVPTDKRYRLYRPASSQTRPDPKRHWQYDSIIKWAAEKHALDFALIKAIIHVESGFDPWAVSEKGARGLMQLMPGTSRLMEVSDPFNPKENIDGGVRFLRWLLSELNGDMVLALAAYNSGLDMVRKYNSVPPFEETTQYVKKVLHQFQGYQ